MVQQQVEETLRSIDLAGDLGAPVVRVFGGRIPEGVSRRQAIEGVAAALRTIGDQAAARAVTVCLETHDDWCDPDHVAEAVRQAEHNAIAVNWDVLHGVRVAIRLTTLPNTPDKKFGGHSDLRPSRSYTVSSNHAPL